MTASEALRGAWADGLRDSSVLLGVGMRHGASEDEARRLIAALGEDSAGAPKGNGAGPAGPRPLVDDITSISFGRFLESEPPARQMLVEDVLPLNVVGLLASMGGTGKSMLLYQLGICVATGLPWLGLRMSHVGGVLALMAEDPDDELHRRAWPLVRHVEGLGYVDRHTIAERLHVLSRVAADNLLTVAGPEGDVHRTELVGRVIATARKIPDLKLIVLDPTSRFRGGRANAEEDTTRYVEALVAIRDGTGATVLASVHVNKASIREPGDADQAAVRGSSALVDGVRWVATLQRLRRDAASDYGLEPEHAERYVRLDLAKSNYTAPWPGTWLYREAGGIMVPTTLERKQQRTAEVRYEDVLARIVDLIGHEGPMTRNRMERDYAGASGVLGVGMHTCRSVVARAVTEGALVESPDPAGRGGTLLSPPEVDA